MEVFPADINVACGWGMKSRYVIRFDVTGLFPTFRNILVLLMLPLKHMTRIICTIKCIHEVTKISVRWGRKGGELTVTYLLLCWTICSAFTPKFSLMQNRKISGRWQVSN